MTIEAKKIWLFIFPHLFSFFGLWTENKRRELRVSSNELIETGKRQKTFFVCFPVDTIKMLNKNPILVASERVLGGKDGDE